MDQQVISCVHVCCAAFTYTQTLMSIHGSTADKRRSDGGPTALRRRSDGGPTAAVRRCSDGGPTYFPPSGMPLSATIRGLDRARRRAESEACGTLLLQYILNYLCHRATWRLIIQRNYTCRCIQASKHAKAQAIASGSEYWRCRDPVIPLRYSDLALSMITKLLHCKSVCVASRPTELKRFIASPEPRAVVLYIACVRSECL